MKIELVNAVEKYLEKVKELYDNAFPEEEKKPFFMLQERYHKQRFFLEIERTGVSAPNAKQRERRKRFYLSNGMNPMDYYVEVRR